MKNGTANCGKVWQFFKKLNTELPYYLAIPLQGIYPKEQKARIQTGICTFMFTAVLFTTAKKVETTQIFIDV